MEVHSQTEYPYVSFMGENLTNHSYVHLAQVGTRYRTYVYISSWYYLRWFDTTLHCVTDLDGCYSSYCGSWYFPDEERVQAYNYRNFYTTNGNQIIYLNHNVLYDISAPSGIYHCEVVVSDESINKTVYVGLYHYYEG